MSWLFFVFIAVLSLSIGVIIDKHLIDRRFEFISSTTVTALAALAGIPFLAILVAISDQLPNARTLVLGFLAGWLVLAAYQLYYTALRKADASLVSSLFQFILPINYVLGILFFNERLALIQIAGLVLISLSATIIASEEKESKWKLRKEVLLTMLLASLLISVSDVVFKEAAQDAPFIVVAITEYTSTIVAGLLLLVFKPSIRKELRKLRGTYKKLLTIVETNELFTLTGMIALRYAIVLGPIALVQGAMGAQPMVILLLTGLLAYFFPKYRQHTSRSTKRLATEVTAMCMIIIGAIFITA